MQAQTNMLEYSKVILEKVSFDIKLFEKELDKAIKQLANEEIKDLLKWCEKKFNDLFNSLRGKYPIAKSIATS